MGQLGDGSQARRSVPVRVDIFGVDSISAGSFHSCANRQGELHCWGAQAGGLLGNGEIRDERTTPQRIGTSNAWSAISAGALHSCGIQEGKLFCWGARGRLGVAGANATSPLRVGDGENYLEVTAGISHTCALRDQELWCWGNNDHGQLGTGSPHDVSTPVRVGSGAFTAFHVGGDRTCGIAAGALYCWGSNGSGALGYPEGFTPQPLGSENATR